MEAGVGRISLGRTLRYPQTPLVPITIQAASKKAVAAYLASSAGRKAEETAPNPKKGECSAKREQESSSVEWSEPPLV
jgi:hypothetical protein